MSGERIISGPRRKAVRDAFGASVSLSRVSKKMLHPVESVRPAPLSALLNSSRRPEHGHQTSYGTRGGVRGLFVPAVVLTLVVSSLGPRCVACIGLWHPGYACSRARGPCGVSPSWIPHDTCTCACCTCGKRRNHTNYRISGSLSLARVCGICGSRVAWGLEGVTFKAIELFTPYAYNSQYVTLRATWSCRYTALSLIGILDYAQWNTLRYR